MVLQIPQINSQTSYFRLIRKYAHEYLNVSPCSPEEYVPLSLIAKFLPHDEYKEFMIKLHFSPHINGIKLPNGETLVHPDGAFEQIKKHNRKYLKHFKRTLTCQGSSQRRS